jgi:hypothetical protein
MHANHSDTVAAAISHEAGAPSGVFVKLLLTALVAGLVVMNLATLLNDTVHTTAFGAVRAILGTVLDDAALSRVVAYSPTVTRRSEVGRATREMLAESQRLRAANAKLASDSRELGRIHGDLTAKHRNLEALSRKQANAAVAVSRRVAARSLGSAIRSAGSVAGKAIPIAGTGLIIGMTAWEIHDLCETMKDMAYMGGQYGEASPDASPAVCGFRPPTAGQVLYQLQGGWKQVYATTAGMINSSGVSFVDASAPFLTWQQAGSSLCPLLGRLPGLCP